MTTLIGNKAKFREVYFQELKVSVQKHPEDYRYSSDPEIARVVDNMTEAFAKNGAGISNAIRRTCRKLGIKATFTEIKKFLNS
ncbi:MAG: hypothetical protein HPY53_01695 [Brevinematales bacterium]|nr:hypothetical protein [Brevinematales bacterium]